MGINVLSPRAINSLEQARESPEQCVQNLPLAPLCHHHYSQNPCNGEPGNLRRGPNISSPGPQRATGPMSGNRVNSINIEHYVWSFRELSWGLLDRLRSTLLRSSKLAHYREFHYENCFLLSELDQNRPLAQSGISFHHVGPMTVWGLLLRSFLTVRGAL